MSNDDDKSLELQLLEALVQRLEIIDARLERIEGGIGLSQSGHGSGPAVSTSRFSQMMDNSKNAADQVSRGEAPR